jgi:hypothetical protein
MKALLDLLAHNKRYWLPPILLFLALAAWLAWKAGAAPSDPFEYRIH